MAHMGAIPKKYKIPLSKGLSSLHHTTQRIICLEKRNYINLDTFEKKLDTSLSDPADRRFRREVINEYESLYKAYSELTEEETLINRMERRAHIRNAIFRGITTLVIGFSVMLVYWVASELEIVMPLMRLPL